MLEIQQLSDEFKSKLIDCCKYLIPEENFDKVYINIKGMLLYGPKQDCEIHWLEIIQSYLYPRLEKRWNDLEKLLTDEQLEEFDSFYIEASDLIICEEGPLHPISLIWEAVNEYKNEAIKYYRSR